MSHLHSAFPLGRNSSASWLEKPTRHLIFFVHGFGGAAVDTWRDFAGLCSLHLDSDVVFYGYDGLHTSSWLTAGDLRGHLDVFLERPADIINQAAPMLRMRRPDFNYECVTLVAHSLGAIVSRLALVYAYQRQREWLKSVQLVLFAPAHRGSRAASLVPDQLLLAAQGLAMMFPGFGWNYEVARDLRPDSEVLSYLAIEVDKALAAGASTWLKARKVIFGMLEKVVIAGPPFGGDPPPDTIAGKDHRGVCKPSNTYMDPVTLLAQVVGSC